MVLPEPKQKKPGMGEKGGKSARTPLGGNMTSRFYYFKMAGDFRGLSNKCSFVVLEDTMGHDVRELSLTGHHTRQRRDPDSCSMDQILNHHLVALCRALDSPNPLMRLSHDLRK